MEARSSAVLAPSGISLSDRELIRALLETLAYADVFDYPLTAAQAHRYLIGLPATRRQVAAGLAAGVAAGRIGRRGSFFFLPGREHSIDQRARRASAAERLWPAALHYGRWLARLPFVRMVALTGALAMHNAEADADLDYFLVSEPRRLWMCRAMAILAVRLAAQRGIELCPNYLITTRALSLSQQDLYTAHELTQMVPIAGSDIYTQMRSVNRWVDDFLPNAVGPPGGAAGAPIRRGIIRRSLEWGLHTRLIDPLERWEMGRKVRRFREQAVAAAEHFAAPEAVFSADCCKGHLSHHAAATLDAFDRRRRQIHEARA